MAVATHLLLLIVIVGVSLSMGNIVISPPNPKNMDENERYIHTLTQKSAEAARNGTTLAAVLRGPNRQRIMGVEGLNFEMNATEPYLVCALYDPTHCDPAVQSNCPTTQTCYLSGAHVILSCLTVFNWQPPKTESNVTTFHDVPKESVRFQGCQELMKDMADEWSNKKCTNKKDQKHGFRSCLCMTKMCNEVGNVQVEMPPYQPNVENRDAAQETSKIVPYLIGGILFVFASAIGVLIYVGWMAVQKRKQRNGTLENKEALETMLESDNIALQDIQAASEQKTSSSTLKCTPTYNITDLQHITNGRYGQVYCGNLNSDRDDLPERVAVKKHELKDVDSYMAEKHIFELLLALPKWYPAILRFVVAEQIYDELWIVTEYHERLSLYELLKNNTISLATATRVMLSAVDGLQFLHDDFPYFFQHEKPVIIHRDIKSKNILIRRDMTAVVADFGLARVFETSMKKNQDLYGQVGTRRYMAPEVLEAATEFTPAAFKQMDVYAMALVMWEVMSRIQLEDETAEDVPAYQLPYENYVGMNPTIPTMRKIVVKDKVRPAWRDALSRFQRTRDLKSIVVEMWDPEAYGRITAGCAFDRMVKMILEDQLRRPANDNDVKSVWSTYLASPDTSPYPSADPFAALPPPPPIPAIGADGVVGEGEVVDARDSGRMHRRHQEKVYDVARRRFLTDEEIAEGRVHEEFQVVERSISPDVSDFESD